MIDRLDAWGMVALVTLLIVAVHWLRARRESKRHEEIMAGLAAGAKERWALRREYDAHSDTLDRLKRSVSENSRDIADLKDAADTLAKRVVALERRS